MRGERKGRGGKEGGSQGVMHLQLLLSHSAPRSNLFILYGSAKTLQTLQDEGGEREVMVEGR